MMTSLFVVGHMPKTKPIRPRMPKTSPGQGRAYKRWHYCGPAALSAIIGEPTTLTVDLLDKRRQRLHYNRKHVGHNRSEMVGVLRERGFTVVPIVVARNSRLIDIAPNLPWSGVHLIESTTHWLVLHRGIVYDSGQPDGREFSSHNYSLAKICRVWQVEKKRLA